MRSKPLSRMRARTCTPPSTFRTGVRERSSRPREERERVAPSQPERKLAAILAADIEGYSRLMHEDEEVALATLSSHREIIDGLITAAHGRVTGSAGDSVLAEFASIVDAVHCGVAIQQALAKANADLSAERRLELRIGINVGDVMVQDGDVFGDGVNIAARLEGLAAPGGICVSRSVRDHVRDRVAYEFDDLGEQCVKNIARPLRVFRLVVDPNVPALPPTQRIESLATDNTVATETGSLEISFWQSVEAGSTFAEYQAYLERYPDGSFATLARARLAVDPVAAVHDHSVEVAFWNSVKDSTDPEMFLAYLGKYPQGEFASLAEIGIRIAETKISQPSGIAALAGLLKSAFSSEADS
jgi:adenylate cyclase